MAKGLGRSSRSVRTAKKRLKILLATDRTNCTPDNFNHMRADVLSMISRYMNIDSEKAKICMRQQSAKGGERTLLCIQVPLEPNK